MGWLIVLLLAGGLQFLAATKIEAARAGASDTGHAHDGKSAEAGHAEGGHEEHAHGPFDHVLDHEYFELPGGKKISLKKDMESPGLTKYMVLELLAALLVAGIYIPMARRAQAGDPPRGAWDNAFESLLTFIRDQVARPNLGEHSADKHVPFLWTMFLFILFCNLLGMIPMLGSPTASLYVTGALAAIVYLTIAGKAIAELGLWPYVKSQAPHIDLPKLIGIPLMLSIGAIEVGGNVIKCVVLAVRLFANMFAGHTVLSMILLFILTAANAGFALWASVTLGSVLGVVALSLLELFVAFLQAYIFIFLTSLFMGMALHPEH